MRFNLSALLRPIRLFIAVCFCGVLMLSFALPALSANPPASDPRSGEANLLEIERKAQEAVLASPYDIQKQVDETNPGLNVDQGSADIEQMKRPGNTRPGVKSVEGIIGKTLEKVAGNDDANAKN